MTTAYIILLAAFALQSAIAIKSTITHEKRIQAEIQKKSLD